MKTKQEPETATAKQVEAIAASAEFKELLKAKSAFILPATVFFVLYYFALPVLVGYAPTWMQTKIGPINLAYLFALSQFAMTWILAAMYMKKASRFDTMAAKILKGGAK
jgi:uncharacterized membrane protein (DUF485 family)